MAAFSSAVSSPTTDLAAFLFLPTDSKETIAQKIRNATAFAMTELANHFHEKWEKTAPTPTMTYAELAEKRSLLREGPWLATAFFTRCTDLKQQPLIIHYKKGNHLIKGFMNPLIFDLEGESPMDEVTRTHHFFRLKKSEDPYEITMNVLNNFSIIEMGVALKIVQYRALAMCLGKPRFNILFSSTGFGLLNFSSRVTGLHQPLSRIIRSNTDKKITASKMIDATEKRCLKVGDYCYFKGHPHYSKKHPYGIWEQSTAICTQSEPIITFSSFGLPPNSIDQFIFEKFVEEFNLPSQQWHLKLPSETRVQKKQKAHKTHTDVPASCTKESIPGFKICRIDKPNAKILRNIAATSIEKLQYMVSFCPNDRVRKQAPTRRQA